MKKIVFIMYVLLFVIISFFSVELYSNYEAYRYNWSNIIRIDGYDKLYEYSLEDRIDKIETIAVEENVNLYQFNHEIKENGSEVLIYYYALGNDQIYNDKFDTYKGYTKTFNPYNEVYSLPISELKEKQIRTNIFIEGDNELNILKAIKRLTSEEINLQQTNFFTNNFIGMLKILIESGIFKLICLIILIFLPTTFYFYYIKYQELHVKISLGFNILKVKLNLLKEVLQIQLSSITLVTILQMILLINYDKIGGYMIFYLIVMLISLLIMLLVNFSIVNLINSKKIISGLKNLRPIHKILSCAFIFEIITTLLVVAFTYMNVNVYAKLDILQQDIDKWSILKEYQDFNFGYVQALPSKDLLINEINATHKAQNIFIESEINGGILINSKYFSNNAKNIEGRILIVNNNYLNIERVKDENERDIKYFSEDKVTLLVPLIYKGLESEFKDIVEKRIQNMRYFLEDSYLKREGEKPIERPGLDIEVKYIKDNQRFFLYDIERGEKDINYAINPVLIVVNGETFGAPLCLSSMTQRYFKAYIDKDFDIEQCIAKYDATSMIKTYNSYDNNVEIALLKLEKSMKASASLFVILIIMQVCTSIATIMIYIEGNKQKIYIKKIHGFSFIKTHQQGIFYYLFLTILIAIMYFKYTNLMNSEILIGILLLKMIIVYVLFKIIENKSIIEGLNRR